MNEPHPKKESTVDRYLMDRLPKKPDPDFKPLQGPGRIAPDPKPGRHGTTGFKPAPSLEDLEKTSEDALFSSFPFFTRMNPPTKVVGRDEEIELLFESFAKKRMKNSILIGNAGSGKTAIVEEVAERLKDKYLFLNFSMNGVVAGTVLRGMFERNMQSSMDAVIRFDKTFGKVKKPVLFIDEIHMIVGAGRGGGDESDDVANIMKPYLSSGAITVIGATTPKEYHRTIEQDQALARRLCPIYIGELDKETVLDILDDFAEGTVSRDYLDYLYEASKTIPNSTNPDVSIEVLDRCLARSKVRGLSVNPDMIDTLVASMQITIPAELS